jgi:hypothetical protein
LCRAAILVELHDFFTPGTTDTLRARFGATHAIEQVWQQPRTRRDFPWTTLGTILAPRSHMNFTVNELRPERMAWLWMTPRAG